VLTEVKFLKFRCAIWYRLNGNLTPFKVELFGSLKCGTRKALTNRENKLGIKDGPFVFASISGRRISRYGFKLLALAVYALH